MAQSYIFHLRKRQVYKFLIRNFINSSVHQHRFDVEARAFLALHVDFADVFAHHAETREHAAGAEPHGEHERRPARDDAPREIRIQHPAQHGERDEQERHSQRHYQADGLDGERGDAVDGKVEHLAEWVFRLAGETLRTVVIHLRRGVANEGHETADEEVALLELQDLFSFALSAQDVAL